MCEDFAVDFLDSLVDPYAIVAAHDAVTARYPGRLTITGACRRSQLQARRAAGGYPSRAVDYWCTHAISFQRFWQTARSNP